MGGKGSGGHNRKPTAVKRRQGNPGKRQLNRREPKPAPGVPEMPKHLSAAARAKWRELVPILDKMGVLTTADGDALAAYCSVYAQWIQAEAAIARYGILSVELNRETGVGRIKESAAVRIKEKSLKLMKAFENEFGLTPASRSKLTATEGRDLEPDVKSQDALEDFLSRKPASRVAQ